MYASSGSSRRPSRMARIVWSDGSSRYCERNDATSYEPWSLYVGRNSTSGLMATSCSLLMACPSRMPACARPLMTPAYLQASSNELPLPPYVLMSEISTTVFFSPSGIFDVCSVMEASLSSIFWTSFSPRAGSPTACAMRRTVASISSRFRAPLQTTTGMPRSRSDATRVMSPQSGTMTRSGFIAAISSTVGSVTRPSTSFASGTTFELTGSSSRLLTATI